jgi:glycosyltransferase involved in cell wall biosynthesis
MNRADMIICLDVNSLNTVKSKVPNTAAVLIPNCVALSDIPERSKEHRERSVLFVGWVVPEKGIRELVDAWNQVKEPGWRLDVIGPVEQAYLQELLRVAVPSAALSFHGALPHAEVLQRIADCDVFVLPSHTEGFPNVVVEAMAMSRAIIGTPVGAIPDMLGDGAGILVSVNEPTELASTLLRLMNDPDTRERLGRAALLKAHKEYSLDHVYSRYEQLWREVSGRIDHSH